MTTSSVAGQSDCEMSAERAVHVTPDGCGPATLAMLLERAGQGDLAAFASVHDATSARTFGVALQVLGDRGEAEEVLHDAYLEIWGRCGRLEAAGVGAMAWILMIVHRAAVQRVRWAAAARDGDPHTPGGAGTGPSDRARVGQAVPVGVSGIGTALAERSAEQRAAIAMAYFAAHTHAEVDHVLGLAPGRALSLIRDGLDRLRERSESA